MGSNVLLLLEDALRYDAYYGKEMQPLRDFLGPVAAYARWYSVSNCSDPNIASMLTGLYPWEHGVRFMGQYLKGHHTLFDTFRSRGYTTLFSGWGRHKVIVGMDEDKSFWSPGHIDETRQQVTPNLKELLRRVPKHDPWFAFVRHMWCHARYVDGSYKKSVATTCEDLIELITWVRERWYDTTVVITADHGEMQGGPKGKDRGPIDAPATPPQHAWGLFEPQVHVPMVVSYPIGSRASQLYADYFQHTNLPALILGHPMGDRQYLQMEGTGVDPKFAAWYHRGVVGDSAKFILGGKDGAQDPLLYCLAANGFDETHNQAQAFPHLVGVMETQLPPHIAYTPAEEQAIIDRLKVLGYGE